MQAKKFIIFIFVILFLLCKNISSQASIYVEVGDEIYNYLAYLEAKGCFSSSLLGTKPISKKEVLRLITEAAQNNKCADPISLWFIEQIKTQISDNSNIDFIQPIEKISFTYAYSDSELISQFLYNQDGDEFQKNHNLRFNFNSVAQTGKFSFFVKPETKYSGDTYSMHLKKAYVIFNIYNMNIFFGKESQWWGPGQNGAILLSNNAEPFTMFSISNDHPIILPWIFKWLGLFKFNFFITRLEEERSVPKPYLWGLRFNFKPHPYLEIGLSRTALLGGKGRKTTLKTWIDSFLGINENVDKPDENQPGDQRGGFDVKLTLPFKFQPIQVYFEAAGEDEAGHLPSKWAYLTGLYLPQIYSLPNLSFKFEYAKTNRYWYVHHIYKDGYTYKDHIIGHHIGNNAQSYWSELSYIVPFKKLIVSVGGEKITYKRFQPNQKEKNIYLSVKKQLQDSLWLHLFLKHYNIEHIEGSLNSENINLFSFQINWRF